MKFYSFWTTTIRFFPKFQRILCDIKSESICDLAPLV